MYLPTARYVLLTAGLLLSFGSVADSEPAPARQMLSQLMGAIASQDYQQFMQLGNDEFQAGISQPQFDEVAQVVGMRVEQGYQAQYLTSLQQQGYRVDLWKISFTDGGDDSLARLVLDGERAAGFLLQ
ncbi:hypothetical protein [Pseudomonas sp. MYb185]|uniref:hypothetical protein n=1 Tax=Pseudomonas sp. MYb185 TaxID=1848729 RepID=UPI000CFBBC83|nr:hypothetical protein [Pseudomonas sp. MYb185]PRB84370.1 hypothetical protein CQ007_00885 [Pseudomonas sp. MYb185]